MLIARQLTAAIVLLSLITFGVYLWGKSKSQLADAYANQHEATSLALQTERQERWNMRRQLEESNAKYKQLERELQDALERYPDWAGTAVPDPVVHGLCHTAHCRALQADDPVPAP